MRTVLFLLLLLLPTPLWSGTITGRVVLGDAPLAGMRIEAHGGLDFSAPPLAVSAPTEEDGAFRLELPDGLYALFARDAGNRYFAFCGRNPVAVSGVPVWAGLQGVPVDPPIFAAYDDEYSAAIEGKILFEGRPLAGAYVSLYLDAAEDLKGQGYRLSLPTGSDGSFVFDGLPESGYFLAARKRQGGGRVGPVLEGDYLAVYPGNPLQARAGKTVRVQLTAVRKVRDEAQSEVFERRSGPRVSGRVSDGKGAAVSGVHVFAYTDRVIGHQRPASLSPATGSDGLFTLTLKEPGTYYLGARERYGDSPAPGELFGMYDESADHGLAVGAGAALEGINITVEPIDLQ